MEKVTVPEGCPLKGSGTPKRDLKTVREGQSLRLLSLHSSRSILNSSGLGNVQAHSIGRLDVLRPFTRSGARPAIRTPEEEQALGCYGSSRNILKLPISSLECKKNLGLPLSPGTAVLRRVPRHMVQSAIAPDGHLRVVGRHGELLDKRPADDYIVSETLSLTISLWVVTFLCTFIKVLCIIILADRWSLPVAKPESDRLSPNIRV
ncbi:hypothetical protein TcWFU_000713 [Taenia crassiceps]|uniref:Uncharacterized protein n=1 Tax=Taenia crassiceps TaxID=6207 RepID=A0ABR4QNH9_9CEST